MLRVFLSSISCYLQALPTNCGGGCWRISGAEACYTEGSLLPDDVEYGFHKTEKYRGFRVWSVVRGKDCVVPWQGLCGAVARTVWCRRHLILSVLRVRSELVVGAREDRNCLPFNPYDLLSFPRWRVWARRFVNCSTSSVEQREDAPVE